jgi:hypothetical protein
MYKMRSQFPAAGRGGKKSVSTAPASIDTVSSRAHKCTVGAPLRHESAAQMTHVQ